MLAAGIKSDGSETTQDSAPKAGIGLGRQDKVVIDGADVNNRSTSSGVDIKLSKEVIAEFEVKTNQFDAQFGQSGTSITQAVTKSGTDQISGSGFFYFRDESLNAEEFFLTDNPATPDNEAKPPYQNKQTGLTLGGPIIKGKTHFFFSYEYQTTPRTLSSNVGIPSDRYPAGRRDGHPQHLVRPRRSPDQRRPPGGVPLQPIHAAAARVGDRWDHGARGISGLRFLDQPLQRVARLGDRQQVVQRVHLQRHGHEPPLRQAR